MIIKVDLKNGTSIEVREEGGILQEIVHMGTQGEIPYANKRYIKMWLHKIMKTDINAFKEILYAIQNDSVFFNYGKHMLDYERQNREKRLNKCQEDYERKVKQLKEDIKLYSLPDLESK